MTTIITKTNEIKREHIQIQTLTTSPYESKKREQDRKKARENLDSHRILDGFRWADQRCDGGGNDGVGDDGEKDRKREMESWRPN